MSVSVLVTVLGSTVTGSAGAAPPVESRLSWWPPPLPPPLAAALVVVAVVVVVVLVVGAVVPFELHATDNRPTATATMPTVNDAVLRTSAVSNANRISLSSQSHDVTVRFIPTWARASGNRTAGGSLRRACCQPAELTGSMGNRRSAAGASAGTAGCSGGIGASRLYGSPCAGR
jgi:hypothetical protein